MKEIEEHYTAILSVKHVRKRAKLQTVRRDISSSVDEREIDHEVGKVVVRANSLDELKQKIKAHVEIL